jgi:hypothetical protein
MSAVMILAIGLRSRWGRHEDGQFAFVAFDRIDLSICIRMPKKFCMCKAKHPGERK